MLSVQCLFRNAKRNFAKILMPLLFREVEGDLFTASKDYSLAHCVASDLKMGAGIAVAFRDTFGRIDELKKQNVQTGGVAILEDQNRFIYYLITKTSTYQKPTYGSLLETIKAMKNHMDEHGVNKLAIPRIGCGLDGLKWDKVKNQLIDVFGDGSYEIVVYTLKR